MSRHGSTEARCRAGASERTTRAALLQKAALVGGTAAAGGTFADLALSAPSPTQDARILNFALLLEYLSAAFYGEALRRGVLKGELHQFAEIVEAHEQAHVNFLTKALGPKARPAPKLDFGRTTSNLKLFVRTAVTLEDTGVGAYNGQATNLTPATLAAAAKIVSVEARHAAWIRDIAGKAPAAGPVDKPLSAARVLAVVRSTGFVKS